MAAVRCLSILLVVLLAVSGCGRPNVPPNPPDTCFEGCNGVNVIDSKCDTNSVTVLSGRVQPDDMTDLRGVLVLKRGVDWGTDKHQKCSNIYWSEFWPDNDNTLDFEVVTDVSAFRTTPSAFSSSPTKMARTFGFFVGINQRVNAHVCNRRDILPQECGRGLSNTVGSQ